MAELTAEQRALAKALFGYRVDDAAEADEIAPYVTAELRKRGFAIIPLEPHQTLMDALSILLSDDPRADASRDKAREVARAAYSTIAGGADG